ncbi:HDOD domain-containing protein [Parvibium lacunae]|uniref:HDOD domain-containing protein n=1 Tax=Parvibium lacunae TaxID=1888893 RepID=A0A368L6M7_9BURK|nr:HDOD domain-containing protein [Parvibium lacunae]RCS59212.1 HDOD domain-containing protein [Parvibium lacunae]
MYNIHPEFDDAVLEARNLPAFSSEFIKELQLLTSDELNTAELAKHIRLDPALTARILRVANSPFFGMQRHIESIEEAILIVGLRHTRGLVIAGTVMSALQPQPKTGLDPEQFWRNTLATTAGAQSIAHYVLANHSHPQAISVDAAFVAGILHDIGKLMMAVTWESRYLQVSQLIHIEKLMAHEAEQRIFSYDHSKLGAAICERWWLPNAICHAIHYHHEAQRPTLNLGLAEKNLAAVLCLADAISPLLTQPCHSEGEANMDTLLALLPANQRHLAELAMRELEIESTALLPLIPDMRLIYLSLCHLVQLKMS